MHSLEENMDANNKSAASSDTLESALARAIKGRTKTDIFSSLKNTVTVLQNRASTNRKAVEDELLAMTRGLPGMEASMSGDEKTAISFNLIYAIIDTAMSGLLPGNPKCAARPLNVASRDAKQLLDAYMDTVFVENKVRRNTVDVLLDCLIHNYGIFKTTWDSAAKMARIESRPARQMFFDLNPRRVSDIRWFAECEPVALTELYGTLNVEARDAEGNVHLSVEDIDKMVQRAKDYPDWLLDPQRKKQDIDTLNLDRWLTVWRFYDRTNNKYVVYIAEADLIIHDGPLESLDGAPYIPFTIVTLTANGVNAEGVADTKVIHRLQQNLDRLLTLVNQVCHAQAPKIWADGGTVSQESVTTANEAAPGATILVPPTGDGQPRERFANSFYAAPIPELSSALVGFIAQLKEMVAYTTAVSDPARGQLANARTATEVAYMDVNTQSRLGSRRAFLYDGFEDVANKCFRLAQKFLDEDVTIFLQTSGVVNDAPVTLAAAILKSAMARFEMIAYNPVRENPMVVIEALHNNMALFLQVLPPERGQALIDFVLRTIGAPSEVMGSGVPAQAQLPGAPGQAPGAPGAPPEGAALPPPTAPLSMVEPEVPREGELPPSVNPEAIMSNALNGGGNVQRQ